MLPLLFGIIFVSNICSVLSHKPGGYYSVDPKSDPKFMELAHFATSSQTGGRKYYDTVVELLEVKTQVVAGMNYKLKMRIGPSICKIEDTQYSREQCLLQEGVPATVCTAVIYEIPWLNNRTVTDYKCEVVSDNTPSIVPPKHLTFGYISKHLRLSQTRTLFDTFLKSYNKSYVDKREHEVRFKVFKRNLKRIALFNKMEKGTAHYGLTEFSDLSPSEFQQYHTGLKKSVQEHMSEVMSVKVPVTEPLPTNFDWRTKGAVTPVKNQGACGSCWAFSTTGNIEGQWFLARKKLVSLSEQELVDCDSMDHGCAGGYMGSAYKAVIQLGGLETETEYPYRGRDESCEFNKTEAKVRIKSYVGLPQNETELAYWLMKHGPVSVGINANAMQFYFGGISHPWKFLCSPDDLDHGVLLVGFGVDKTIFRKKPKPYWIIKNSWGKFWGEKGYYRVYRGDGTCGVNKMATSAVVPQKHQ
ncbi:cathepsin L-like [Ornithodoros turicata]|uniref:cathepsin L-like n=1 Tax=Ornithodoros turicata TaxID=34597 RepID=UPI003138B1DC